MDKETELAYIESVRLNGDNLKFIDDQTEEICIEAVRENGYALLYVKNQTETICMEAVRKNGYALKFVKNQTEAICKTAVGKDGMALRLVEKRTEDICKTAIMQNGMALQFVKNKTYELCKMAVEQNMHSLFCVPERFIEEICKELDMFYMEEIGNCRSLIIKKIKGKYKCWIGCQFKITLDTLIHRIYNENGGLEKNPHRQIYLNFLMEKGLITNDFKIKKKERFSWIKNWNRLMPNL